MGIVVMGTGQEDKMRILCYDKAKAQVMAVGISGLLDIIPQPGLFVSLKDDAGAVWSIRFKSEEVMNGTRGGSKRVAAWVPVCRSPRTDDQLLHARTRTFSTPHVPLYWHARPIGLRATTLW